MPLFVRDIALRLGESENQLRGRLAARLKLPPADIRLYGVVRRSIDARYHDDIKRVYCLEVALASTRDEQRLVRHLRRGDVSLLAPVRPPRPSPGQQPMPERPVVVGFGPAGMFAAWRLAVAGYRPVVLERGRPVKTRHRDILLRFYQHGDFDAESNLLYGEGGAGTYSDGKLYTRRNHPYVQLVKEVLYQHGARPDVLLDGRPHIGSDRLPNICMRIRRRIEALGGEIRFEGRLDDVVIGGDGALHGVVVDGATMAARHVILAVGHSARDTLRMLHGRGVRIAARAFQLGVRVEHPQSLVDTWQYGSCSGHPDLPPADYHVVARGAAGAGDLFSFCMCPGGTILPTNESPGLVSTNGASAAARGGHFANSGLVVTIPPEEFGNDPLAGLAYQQHWEALAFAIAGGDYAVPAQRAADLLAGRRSDGELAISYPLGGRWCDVSAVVPGRVSEALRNGLPVLERCMPGFSGDQAIITAPETRASAPLRMERDPHTRQSLTVAGLYPAGEGAGYAGGILSAAIDGLLSADHLISSFAPPR